MPFVFTSKVYQNLNLKVILAKKVEFNLFIFLFNHTKLINHSEYFYLALHFIKMIHPSWY